MIAKSYQAYDHRIKELIAKSSNPYLFPEISIPKSTALTWIRGGIKKVRSDLTPMFVQLTSWMISVADSLILGNTVSGAGGKYPKEL